MLNISTIITLLVLLLALVTAVSLSTRDYFHSDEFFNTSNGTSRLITNYWGVWKEEKVIEILDFTNIASFKGDRDRWVKICIKTARFPWSEITRSSTPETPIFSCYFEGLQVPINYNHMYKLNLDLSGVRSRRYSELTAPDADLAALALRYRAENDSTRKIGKDAQAARLKKLEELESEADGRNTAAGKLPEVQYPKDHTEIKVHNSSEQIHVDPVSPSGETTLGIDRSSTEPTIK